jgi:hypothetical protein
MNLPLNQTRFQKRILSPFLAKRMLSCPGMGPFGHRESSPFAEPVEDGFCRFFSPKLKMILKKKPHLQTRVQERGGGTI